MSLSKIMRPFNKNAVNDNKQKVVDRKKREKIIRIEGRERVEQFTDHCDDFDAKVCEEMEKLRTKKFNSLCEFITGDEKKISRVDLEGTKDQFVKGVEKIRKVTKSELNPCGVDVTADMGGAVKMTALTNKVDTVIFVEVSIRQIELPNNWTNLSFKEKRDILRKDEIKRLAAEGKARDGIKIDDIKQIIPVSDEMIAMMESLNE